VSFEVVTSTLEAARHIVLANLTQILQLDGSESTKITNSISKEEITSESESELNNHGNFQVGSSSSSSLQGPLKKKL